MYEMHEACDEILHVIAVFFHESSVVHWSKNVLKVQI